MAASSTTAPTGATPGRIEAFERLMRQYNSRLFRVARAIVKHDADAEDVLQEAYLQAYRQFSQFRGDAQISTWLTRIVVNQALMRLRQQKREAAVVPFPEGGDTPEVNVPDERVESAGDAVLRSQVRQVLERKIDSLPESFRAVFVLREVEELSVEETARCLEVPASTVRTRLFRARALLRQALAADVDRAILDVYGFDGERCDRIVAAVLQRLRGNASG